MKNPVITAVRNTPMVARNIPGVKTGFISVRRVSSPPENKIIFKAITPIYCARRGEENSNPSPS
jgi:hypothetical protein